MRVGSPEMSEQLPRPEYPKEVTLPGETVMLLETLQSSPVNAKQIAEWTAKDPVLSKVKKWRSQGWTDTDDHAKELWPYRRKEELWLYLVGIQSVGARTRSEASD